MPFSSSDVVLHDLSAFFGSFSDVTLLHINTRGWRSHSDELSSYLHALPEKPKLIALNETFINRSVKVFLPAYKIVGRRDRETDEINAHIDNLQSWGGILLLFRKNSTVQLQKSLGLPPQNVSGLLFIVTQGLSCFAFGIVHQLVLTLVPLARLQPNWNNFAKGISAQQ